MKRIYLALTLLCLSVISSRAAVTFALDAGFLRGSGTNPSFMPVGGLLLLISNTGESTFNTAALNQYVTGDDTILGAFAMNYAGGTGEDQTTLSNIAYGGTVLQGDEVALRWFPNITYTQYLSGTLPTAGSFYGTKTAGK